VNPTTKSKGKGAEEQTRLVKMAALLCAAFALTTFSSRAQEIYGTPGSPDATMTIDGKQLPAPDPKFGGVINETAWPARIKDVGSIRSQFHHMIDIVPTILEVSGIPAPEFVDGIKQAPICLGIGNYSCEPKQSKA
jgi:hypothetical protein